MRSLPFVVVVALACALGAQATCPTEEDCIVVEESPDVFSATLGDHYYRFVGGKFNYESGAAAAAALGGNLASVHSDVENACVRKLLEAAGVQGSEETMIGFRLHGKWMWDSYEKPCYTNWDVGEPNNQLDHQVGGERCAVMYIDGFWNDQECLDEKHTRNIVVEIGLNGYEDFCPCVECPTSAEYSTEERTVAGVDKIVFTWMGHRYVLSSAPATFEMAEAEAKALGGQLVSIHDEYEAAVVHDLIAQMPEQDNFWIGLARARQADDFAAWTSSEALCYDEWDEGEPNRKGTERKAENCAVINQKSGWNNLKCSLEKYFVIEVGWPFGDKLCQCSLPTPTPPPTPPSTPPPSPTPAGTRGERCAD